MELPASSARVSPEATLVVAISDDAILLGGKPITSVGEALAGEGLLIDELEAGLDRELTRMEELAGRKGQNDVQYKVTIQGDRDLEFQLLQRVMYTCSESGLEEMALAVVQKGRS